jgi:S1-C subfamily serine protease
VDERPHRKVKKESGSALPLILVGSGLAVLLVVGLGIGGIVWAYSGSTKADQTAQQTQDPPAGPGGQEQPKGQDQGALPAEMARDVLAKVKQSSAYLRVNLPNGDVAQGTGWFAVEPGIVITNAHVLGMLGSDSQVPNNVAVWVNHGEANQFKLDGLVQGVDRTNDLAVLRVDNAAGKPLPTPLQIDPSDTLRETQKVYIFGFPYGLKLGKNITVSESTISSLRRDQDTHALNQIQVNGGMHPGNSGGPVTDTRGRVIGVSVAGIPGTQLNFAIPTRFVKQVLAGRFTGSEFGVPYSSGSGVNVPVQVTALDPLDRVKDIKVEFWAGSPGKPRSETFTKPAAEPGDGPRQSVKVSGRAGVYSVDVPLPPLAPGQVCWVQPVLDNALGVTQWGQAISYTHDPSLVLERKSALLEFRPPSGIVQRTLKITSTDAVNVYQGDNHRTRSQKMDGYVLEMLGPDPGGQGTGIRLTLGRATITRERDRRVEPLPPEIYSYLARFSPTFTVDYSNRAKGRGKPSFGAVPRLHRETVSDLFGDLCNAWEVTTVQLANRTVRPQESWPAEIPMLIEDEFTRDVRDKVVRLYVKCTFEGLRTVAGRTEAYIRINGIARGQGRRADIVFGKVSGHALLDVEKGFLTYARTLISTEVDTESHGLRILVTSESTVSRVEGNTQGIRPATTSEPVVKKPPPKIVLRGPLHLVASGVMVPGKEITLTAYVERPAANTVATLTLSPGLALVSGTKKMAVPPIPAGVGGNFSPVTWRIKATRSGNLPISVTINKSWPTGKPHKVEWAIVTRAPGTPPGGPKS